tara:strand:+ start:3752 stop:3991 length:240 start_codon:yes stop_codon:yes gene_type:complete
MNNQVLTAAIVSVVFFLIKFFEMRFIIKENKPLKVLVIDSLIVFISTTLTLFLLQQFNIDKIIGNSPVSPDAFINNPDF